MDEDTDTSGRPRGNSETHAASGDDSFSLMRSYLDKQFRGFKRDIREEIQSSSAVSLKKFKHSSQLHNFKRLGNRRQFEFNCDILDDIDTVCSQVKHGEQDQSLVSLDTLQKKVERRNKLVKLADKSEGGWDTVKEYESDDLASDSDDDKRIRRAESRALSKKKKRFPPRFPVSQPLFTGQSAAVGPFGGFQTRPEPGSFQPFRRGNQSLQCFACGGWGHVRAECPRMGPTATGVSGQRRGVGSWPPVRFQPPSATASRPTDNVSKQEL